MSINMCFAWAREQGYWATKNWECWVATVGFQAIYCMCIASPKWCRDTRRGCQALGS